jgi:glycosyltransferase involved in cell wall biosynthesis
VIAATVSAPEPGLRASVVVPARDEAELIGACLDALSGVAADAYEVVLVLDGCRDATGERAAEAAARHPGLRLQVLTAAGAGHARKTGMDLACARLLAVGRPDGLVCSTDADTRVAGDWLDAMLRAAGGGAEAIGGRIELDAAGRLALPPGVLEQRARLARARHDRVLAGPDGALGEHWQFSGGSLAVTAATYGRVGGLEPRAALEDEALERSLARHGVAVARPLGVRATTSARVDGRAPHGLARDLALSSWLSRRSYRRDDFALEDLLAAKAATVSAILPAREVADTVGAVLDGLAALRAAGLLDEVVVVDAASADGTAEVAAARGARVVQDDALLREHGPARGKGDAMWRGATSGDIVVFLDTDTEDFDPGFVAGLLGPLLTDPGVALVKAAFARPFRAGDAVVPHAGGRVTELLARPFLSLHVPELAGFAQPLAGEIAARRGLLEALPFPVGYGIEIAMLIDAAREVGVDALAQVWLGSRQNRHQPLRELSAMAYAVLVAASSRVLDPAVLDAAALGPLALPYDETLEVRSVAVEERPPLASLRPARAAS